MGFLEYKDKIELNDLVILYINFNTMYPVQVTATVLSKKGAEVENIYQTKYGSLRAVELVGVRYGTKVQLSRGYGYALQPTPELWTKATHEHSFQPKDVSFIHLHLAPPSSHQPAGNR